MSSNDFLNGLLWADITDTSGSKIAAANRRANSNAELAEQLMEENRELRKRLTIESDFGCEQVSVRSSMLDEIRLMDAGLIKRRNFSHPGPEGKAQRDKVEARSRHFSEQKRANGDRAAADYKEPYRSIYRDPDYCRSIGLDFEQVKKVLGI